jgi:hypothetical protein
LRAGLPHHIAMQLRLTRLAHLRDHFGFGNTGLLT